MDRRSVATPQSMSYIALQRCRPEERCSCFQYSPVDAAVHELGQPHCSICCDASACTCAPICDEASPSGAYFCGVPVPTSHCAGSPPRLHVPAETHAELNPPKTSCKCSKPRNACFMHDQVGSSFTCRISSSVTSAFAACSLGRIHCKIPVSKSMSVPITSNVSVLKSLSAMCGAAIEAAGKVSKHDATALCGTGVQRFLYCGEGYIDLADGSQVQYVLF